jgi:hypothetical protein
VLHHECRYCRNAPNQLCNLAISQPFNITLRFPYTACSHSHTFQEQR